MTEELDYTFRAMGSDIRLLIGRPLVPRAPTPLEAADRERAFVLRLRAPPVAVRPGQRAVGPQPRPALGGAGVRPAPRGGPRRRCGRRSAATAWSTRRSCRRFERNGYATSRWTERVPPRCAEALRPAPPRRPARPDPPPRWRRDQGRRQTRARSSGRPGVMLDTGGTGKGLCADAVAYRLGAYTRFVVDCGGDIAVGGVGRAARAVSGRGRAPAHRRVDRIDLAGTRRRGHLRPQRPHLARPPRTLRPPPARPEHRRTRLDRD